MASSTMQQYHDDIHYLGYGAVADLVDELVPSGRSASSVASARVPPPARSRRTCGIAAGM
jgi:hypothetical protein